MKRLMACVLLLCVLFSLSSLGLTEEKNADVVVLGENSKAYLISVEDKTYLLGYADQDALSAEAADYKVDYVVQYCTHTEHMTLKQELALGLNAEIITVEELPEQMRAEGAVIHGNWAFSGEKKAVEAETFDCLGNYLKFAASTNEASVNVRKTPSTKGDRVDKLKRGDILTVTGQVVNDKGEIWYQVELANGKVGYIRSDLLESADEVPETKEATATENKKEQRYIGNKKSKVFHRSSCSHLPSSKNIVYFSSRSYAVSKGYKPCSHCNP